MCGDNNGISNNGNKLFAPDHDQTSLYLILALSWQCNQRISLTCEALRYFCGEYVISYSQQKYK